MFAFDGHDNVLAMSDLQAFGVDSTTDIFSSVRGTRTHPWWQQLSGVNTAVYIKIGTFYAHHIRLLGNLGILVQIGTDLYSVFKAVEQLYGALS